MIIYLLIRVTLMIIGLNKQIVH